MSFLRNVFGGSSTPTPQITGAETIERLCDRVQSSSLLEDRRDAVKAIRSLSKKHKLDVGTQTMPILIDILEKDRNDTEICNYALDILFNIMNYDETNNEEQKDLPSDLTQQFSEVYIKDKENVQLLINLLDEYEFRIKWPTVRLLNQLILNCRKQMQEILMLCPMAISKLMDLLVDSREIIRNDVILLLNNLTKSHANIQKIVVFENCYERLFEIIDNEGGCLDGGIIVEDCLQLLLNLISNNSSNQSFFIEGNYIKRICKYFDLNTNQSDDHHHHHHQQQQQQQHQQQLWSSQQLKNFNLLLKSIRTLVSPSNQQTTITNCQKSINYCGLLHRLCAMLMISGVPPDLLTETISTVGEVIRGNESNQQFFASVMAPSIPPRQIIILLLMSMINEKQPFMLRLSILYCLQSYLYKNENGQAQIIDSLLLPPSSNVEQQVTSGQLLCAGLFSDDPISNWLCASAISHSILDNSKQKEQLLRVQLSNQLSNQTTTFMQQCVSILQTTDALSANKGNVASTVSQTDANKNQTKKIAILMLISTWLCEDKTSVTYFLSQTSNIPYLISQISAHETDEKCLIIQGLCAFLLGLCVLFNSNQVEMCTQDKLKDTIKKRIGIEQFEDKLEYVSQSELYTKILQKQLFNYTSADQLLYDYEFLRLFKSNETIIMKVLKTSTTNGGSNGIGNNINEQQQNSVIITQYKQLIREQDQQLNEYKLNSIEQQQIIKTLNETIKQLESNYQLLKDQHSLLRATSLNNASQYHQMTIVGNNNEDEINRLRIEIENLKQQNRYYENEFNKISSFNSNTNGYDHHATMNSNNNDLTVATNNYIEQLKNEIINERAVSIELRNELERKNEENNLLRINGGSCVDSLTNDARVHELKLQLNMLNEKLNEQSDLISKLQREKGISEEKLINLNVSSQQNQKNEHDLKQQQLENKNLKEELKKLNEEQENLLFLLQEMEDKCKNYRKLLKQYGYTMIEDEDEEVDDEAAVLNDDDVSHKD